MKKVVFTIFILMFVLQSTAQNIITLTRIDTFKLGEDKEVYEKELTINESIDVMSEDKRYKIKSYQYKANNPNPIIIAGVRFKSVTLDFAFDTKLCNISFRLPLIDDMITYNSDSTEVYLLKLKNFIESKLQIKNVYYKNHLREPVIMDYEAYSWSNDEIKNSKKQKEDLLDFYILNLIVVTIFDKKKKVTEKTIQLSLLNRKYN